VSSAKLTTAITTSDERTITVRGRNLVDDIIGHRTYTEMVFFLITGQMPQPPETRVLDACLVTLMEHGLTPSAIITRLVADNISGESQVAMSAGLLAVGDVFVGTIEGCARILLEATLSGLEPEHYARATVAAYRARHEPVPGFGHRLHKPDDPRALRLLAVASECGFEGRYVEQLRLLSAALDTSAERHITINATGVIAALLLEIGIPLEAMRPLAVVSRCGGLPGHILEERQTGSGRRIWRLVDDSFDYDGISPLANEDGQVPDHR
jgi:citrate synthase